MRALMQAAENGKRVTALVELKALIRRGGQRGLGPTGWSGSGVHVVFGFLDLKTHCKVSLVVRQEGEHAAALRASGDGQLTIQNTALLYTDLGLLHGQRRFRRPTASAAVQSADRIFARSSTGAKLVVALASTCIAAPWSSSTSRRSWPEQGRPSCDLRQAQRGVVDYRVIEGAVRRAARRACRSSCFQVRGMCCLRPGLPRHFHGNIRVTSIVDRFLEHSRDLCLQPRRPGARSSCPSVDWMPPKFPPSRAGRISDH